MEHKHNSSEIAEIRKRIAKFHSCISAGHYHTVGLRVDGTVVATGANDEGQCNVSSWCNIVAISAGYQYTVGLKVDGTVIATGRNDYGQCNVSDWQNIVAISAGDSHTVGLMANGTVVAVGDTRSGKCAISGWRNIGLVSEAKILEWKEEARRREEEARRREEEQVRKWVAQGLCRYCGGKLGGVFTKKCKACGKPQ